MVVSSSFRKIVGMRWDKKHKTWRDHRGKLMEWHDDDPLRFRDAFIWYMCQSNQRWIQRIGWRLWHV